MSYSGMAKTIVFRTLSMGQFMLTSHLPAGYALPMEFTYRGKLPGSKSILNRLLVLKSFCPDLSWRGDSDCDDVMKMKIAVNNISRTDEFDCGEAGTTLRFLTLRLSRESGEFLLRGSKALLSRPQSELTRIVQQLGVRAELTREGVRLKGRGWQRPDQPIEVAQDQSSQFLSAAILSAWNVGFDLQFDARGKQSVSEGYLSLTEKIVGHFGMNIQRDPSRAGTWSIPTDQKIIGAPYDVEMDMSSWAAVAAAAILNGEIEVGPYYLESDQPDHRAVEMLRSMNADVEVTGSNSSILRVRKSYHLRGNHFDLRENPDLYPTLAVLACFANGSSTFRAVTHLQHKESNRFKKVIELLTIARARFEEHLGELKIFGDPSWNPAAFSFDPAHDHRMAMAASLFQLRQPNIKIFDEDVVNKSFPEYWSIIRGRPR